jgi:hypothetical protein
MNEARQFIPSRGEGWADQQHNWGVNVEAQRMRLPARMLFALPRPQFVAKYRYIRLHHKLMKELHG